MSRIPEFRNMILLCLMAGTLSCGISLQTHGQEPFFRQIDLPGNLAEEQVNSVCQDHTGYIWIGTSGGVHRFNGYTYDQPSDPEQLLVKGVTAIFEDSGHSLWFGLSDGNVVRYTNHRFLEPVTADSLPTRRITDIIEGRNNRIWIGTYGDGIYYAEGLRLVKMGNGPHLTDNYIYTFEKDERGRIWVGTDNGINLLDVDHTRFEITHLTVDDGLPDFIIRHIERDRNGNMWIGMHEFGVCLYSLDQGVRVPEAFQDWEFGSVNSLLALDDRLWIATNGSGLVEFRFGSERLQRFETVNQVNLSRIKTMLQDEEDNVWLASGNSLSLSLGNKLEFVYSVEGIPADNIHAVITARNSDLWFANDEGVFSFNPGSMSGMRSFPIGLDLSHQKVMSLYEDPYGFIWIGTFGQGLIRLDPQTGNYTKITEKDGLVNGNVLSIKGNDREVWFATLGGASRMLVTEQLSAPGYLPEFENFGQEEGLSNNFIYDVHIDENDRVWFATDGSGVVRYDRGNFQRIHGDPLLRDLVVYSVTTDMDNNLWMNVSGRGVFKYQNDSIMPYFTDPGHTTNSFSGILANKSHELVIAYDNGIDVLHTRTGEVIHFEENAGLRAINPDLNTLTGDKNGDTWIGTSGSLVCYKSGSFGLRTRPKTVIDKVSLFLEKIDRQSDSVFTHNQNHFSFDYAGLWYQYPEKVVYRIKLEGHDLDWMITKNNNMIYSNLSPGNYTFRVRSGLYENFETAHEATYSFTIRNPYWQTAWFYVLVALFLGGMIYLIIAIRERSISRKQEVEREKIRFQFENLKSQINPHFLFNSFSTLIALIELDPEEAIRYVDELSALFRNVLEYKDRDVIPLEEELKIIDNYIRLQKKRFGNNLRIDIEQPADPGKIMIPPMTLQLLIENAIKHNVASKDRPLKIRIFPDLHKGFIFVTNNIQLKKEVLASTGIGITNIVNRYKLLTDREVKIDKTDESFTVAIPVINRKQ